MDGDFNYEIKQLLPDFIVCHCNYLRLADPHTIGLCCCFTTGQLDGGWLLSTAICGC